MYAIVVLEWTIALGIVIIYSLFKYLAKLFGFAKEKIKKPDSVNDGLGAGAEVAGKHRTD